MMTPKQLFLPPLWANCTISVSIASVNETATTAIWPDTMLRPYGEMLNVTEVAHILNMEERNVRNLLSNRDAHIRLPGVKIGKSWRISRDQLRSYLVTHHNNDTTARISETSRG